MKLKISLVALTVASTLALGVSPIFAEETSETPTTSQQNRNEFRKEQEQRIEARATKAEERKTTIEANVTQRAENRQTRRSDIAQKHAEHLETRFSAMYTRLNTLATKIQTRIDAIKSQGKDTSSAQAKLDSAKTTLESAKSLGAEAVTAFKAIDPAKYDEQRTEALAARDKAEQARKEFVTALQGMKDAVSSLISLKVSE